MAKPRTPSNVLELRGAFKKDPQRRRKDAVGVAPFNPDPPAHLPPEMAGGWRYVVERMPASTWYSCDEIVIEIGARLLNKFWERGDLDTAKELRQWLAKMGMTPIDRLKLAPIAPSDAGNPFAKFAAKVAQAQAKMQRPETDNPFVDV